MISSSLKQHRGVMLTEEETDEWGSTFPEGTFVINGHYFMKKTNHVLQYSLLKNQKAIVPSASVLYVCQDSSLKRNTLVLTEEENNNILECANLCELIH